MSVREAFLFPNIFNQGGLMFVYTVRASTIKFFLVIALTLTVLLAIISVGEVDTVYASADGIEINYGGIKTNEDRVKFIESFGLKVNSEAKEEETFSLPEDFDRVILGYNEIQKTQGLDLTKYHKKKVTHYAYEVTNYDYEGTVYVNLIVYRSRIIACDISSMDGDGFVLPLTSLDEGKIK